MGPRTNRGKQSSNQSKTDDGVDEDILELEVEDDERASSPNRSQMIKPSLVRKHNSKIVVSQVDGSSKILEKQVFLESLNPDLNSNSNNTTSLIPISNSNFNSNKNPQTENSEMKRITIGLDLETTSTEVSGLMKIYMICMGKESLPETQSLIETNLVLEGNHQNCLGISSKDQGEEFSN